MACNNTADSQELAAHAESLGVDAIAAIPPIYFHLPDYAIAKYWNDISAAAPNTDFVIYNIPQLAGVALTMLPARGDAEESPGHRREELLHARPGHPDVDRTRACIVFNGPDEQFLSGLAAGAIGGIGGTYAVMPELYLKIYELYGKGEMETARQIQNEACRIIYKMCYRQGQPVRGPEGHHPSPGRPRRRQRPPAHAPSGRRRRIHRAGSGRDDLGCHREVLLI